MLSQSEFIPKWNGDGDLVLETHRPAGIKYFNQLTLDTSIIFDQVRHKSQQQTYSFLGFVSARISLFFDSISTHNQISSEPTLISVSSIIYSEIFSLSIITYWVVLLNPIPFCSMTFIDKPR
ncbi:MAG: hypothetical protein L0H53_01680 [Candidatus Nitrosocosmicus sp.]|nr:hypothetical protein [Candidatus Nitrosocosmicus sp.]MDN5868223.1 hypothetical protein [Candidatus Nitrosocosmicus sp.]